MKAQHNPPQYLHIISASYRVWNLAGKWKKRMIKVCVSMFVCMSTQTRSFRIKSLTCQWDKAQLQFYRLNKLAIQRKNAQTQTHTHTLYSEPSWKKSSCCVQSCKAELHRMCGGENKKREFNTWELNTLQSKAFLQYDAWSKICLL